MPAQARIPLFLVEDDANLRFLLETAAYRAGVFAEIDSAVDGQAALDALRQRPADHLPGMIVTDLSMPRMDGIELLHALKTDPVLQHIPVAVLTSSDLPHDRADALGAGACAFALKPHGLDALMRTLLSLRASCSEAIHAQVHHCETSHG